jgi:NADH-quinone oxidoreductase subunit L
MPILDHLWIILALPLLGSAINGIIGGSLGKRWTSSAVDAVAVGSVALSFLCVLEGVREFASLAADQIPVAHSYFTWMVAGPFRADFALQVDQLTVVMLLVVTGVGLLVHIFSVGYMAHEGGYYRFFAYLNLFVFFMLTLVLGANLLITFVGWEGVGLCSYLLIGFWFLKKSAADAGKKAFITTRIGDMGFMVGVLLVFATYHTVDYSGVFTAVGGAPVETHLGVITAICLLLFTGAVGKSAQLPLYVWLPDAMEGPTPVSALIHAATMVTAGVYIVARMNPLFSRSPIAMLVVAIVGAVTAFYAATIGIAQTDIKKVLAYSTVSQLGYMFLACGVGAYSAGIFHLMTHAFFKGLLFLCSGSVIHAMGGEQDMLKMGGLWKKIPVTAWTMLIGTLAIAGIFPFAGFFSKDQILFAAFAGPYANKPLWALGLIAALITSFYMFRLIFLTFSGAPRYDEHHVHVHESPWSMLGPLCILAALSLAGGWFAFPTLFGGRDHFKNFLDPVFASSAALAPAVEEASHSLELQMSALAVVIALIGLAMAWWLYFGKPLDKARSIAKSLDGLYTLVYNKYFVDEIYGALIVRPLLSISKNFLWQIVDVGMIDGTVNGAADLARLAGGQARQLQSGNARSYATWVIIGAVGFTALVVGLLGMRP